MNRSNSQARACSTEMIQVGGFDVVVVGVFDIVNIVEVVNEPYDILMA